MISYSLCSHPWRKGDRSSAQLRDVRPALPSRPKTQLALAQISHFLSGLFFPTQHIPSQNISAQVSSARNECSVLKIFHQTTQCLLIVLPLSAKSQSFYSSYCWLFYSDYWTRFSFTAWHSKPSKQKVFSHHLPQPQIMFTRAIFTTPLPFRALK